jgi:hypothetical protein
MAKITVITNSAGEVVGTANFTGGKGAPTFARVMGEAGATTHEIDMADDLAKLSASDLHLKLQKNYFSAVKTKK